MTKLLKLSLFFFLIMLTTSAYAQNFGIKAGAGFTGMLSEESEFFVPYNTNEFGSGLIPGYHLGATIGFPLFDFIIINTGLTVNSKGFLKKDEELFGGTTLVTKDKFSTYYLDLPLSIEVPFTIGDYNLYGTLGSYIGFGLFGNNTTISIFGDNVEKESRSINWGSDPVNDDFMRLDYGITSSVGIILNSINIGLFYNYGIANISSEYDFGTRYNNQTFGISLGYSFGSSKKVVETDSNSPEQISTEGEKIKDSRKRNTPSPADNNPDLGKQLKDEESKRLVVLRADSIANELAEAEEFRRAKFLSDSIEAVRVTSLKIEEDKAKLEKARADSILVAQKAAETKALREIVVYRVQFASTTASKGNYAITIGGEKYNTWEYYYKGAYRATVGEFNSLGDAVSFQKKVRQSGHTQGFVVAFKNGERSTDPTLFR